MGFQVNFDLESKVLKWINNHQEDILESIKEGEYGHFEYPDYWGMPKGVAESLSISFVEYVRGVTQEEVDELIGD